MDLNSNLSDILNLLSSIKSDKDRQELAEKIRYEHSMCDGRQLRPTL